MDTIAAMCGLVFDNIITLIEVGITAGYLVDDDGYCAIGLSTKGQQ